MPNWRPPSISSVRAFEAAARLASFTKAALELNVTQSAVSHGVRDLEQRLGVALLARDGPLALTEAGRAYFAFASEALAQLRAADRAVGDPHRRARVLTISVSPSFAAKWLVPRLGRFAAAHHDLDLRISANPQHIDFRDGEIDLAVRHGDGDWPHLHCEKLCEETLFPVCSPSLMRGELPRSPTDLTRCVLLHHLSVDRWRDWLAVFGISNTDALSHGPILSEMSLALDAAVAGQGVALARSALASRDLAEGRLVRPMPQEQPADFAYWIVCPHDFARTAKYARVRNWLLEEAGA